MLVVRGRTRVDREVIDRGERLLVVARAGSGIDNIDVEYAVRKGISIVNAPESPAQSVAELTIGLLIAAARSIPAYDKLVKGGSWPKGAYTGVELRGKTLGVVGLGRIGSRVASIARAIGMRVVAYDVADVRERAREVGAEVAGELEELLAEADATTLHVPLTPDTYHMIGEREFELMKDGVILVNTSRGPVVDSRALLRALDNGKVRAAALDVLEHEPPAEPWEVELVRHPRTVVTPHVGSDTAEARKRISIEVAYNILEALERMVERR